jgi:hypothetical protein
MWIYHFLQALRLAKMLLHPYNVKTAELAAPVNTDENYLKRIGYPEYKAMYDEFVHLSSSFSAAPYRMSNKLSEWPAGTTQELVDYWQTLYVNLKSLIEQLCACQYVNLWKGQWEHRHDALYYERMLNDFIKK